MAATLRFLIVLAFLARSLVNNLLTKDIRRFETELKGRSDSAIETLKANYSRELETARHTLELENSRMSIVFEHQKDSFRAILAAMHQVISAIEAQAEPESAWYHPIPESVGDAFKAVIAQEGLFVEARCERVLERFSRAISDAVESQHDSPDADKIYQTYDHLKLLARAVANHFRGRVGLNIIGDPLRDADLLGACRLIDRIHFPEAGFPTKGMLSMSKRSAVELVSLANENIGELRQQLTRLRDYIRDTRRTGLFFGVQAEAEEYLRSLTA